RPGGPGGVRADSWWCPFRRGGLSGGAGGRSGSAADLLDPGGDLVRQLVDERGGLLDPLLTVLEIDEGHALVLERGAVLLEVGDGALGVRLPHLVGRFADDLLVLVREAGEGVAPHEEVVVG